MSAGKGDLRRPTRVPDEEFKRRWDQTFGPGDIRDVLEEAGYETVEGADAVRRAIKEATDGTPR